MSWSLKKMDSPPIFRARKNCSNMHKGKQKIVLLLRHCGADKKAGGRNVAAETKMDQSRGLKKFRSLKKSLKIKWLSRLCRMTYACSRSPNYRAMDAAIICCQHGWLRDTGVLAVQHGRCHHAGMFAATMDVLVVLWRPFVRGNVSSTFQPPKTGPAFGWLLPLELIHISNFSKLASCS